MRYAMYPVVRERLTDPSSRTVPDTAGYDPYPVVRERLPDPSSGTAPDTTIVSENRILSQEWSGNSWKRGPETVIGSCFRNASGFPRIRQDPGRILRPGLGILRMCL